MRRSYMHSEVLALQNLRNVEKSRLHNSRRKRRSRLRLQYETLSSLFVSMADWSYRLYGQNMAKPKSIRPMRLSSSSLCLRFQTRKRTKSKKDRLDKSQFYFCDSSGLRCQLTSRAWNRRSSFLLKHHPKDEELVRRRMMKMTLGAWTKRHDLSLIRGDLCSTLVEGYIDFRALWF